MTHKQRWTPWSPYDSLAPKANEPAPGGIGYPVFNQWSAAPLPNPPVPVYDPPGGDYYSKPSQPRYIPIEDSTGDLAYRAYSKHWENVNRELGFFWLGRDADR